MIKRTIQRLHNSIAAIMSNLPAPSPDCLVNDIKTLGLMPYGYVLFYILPVFSCLEVLKNVVFFCSVSFDRSEKQRIKKTMPSLYPKNQRPLKR